MEEMVEYIRVNLNKELWRIDYAAGIARFLSANITINNHHHGETHDSRYTNSEIGNLEGVTGYNGDITQYLQDKGYMWEQLDERSIKFRRHNESNNK